MIWAVIVTYKGDVTKTIEACGTQCPYRLTQAGNTELLVAGHAKVKTAEEALRLVEMTGVVDECKAHGDIIDTRWVFKSEQGEPWQPVPFGLSGL